jgi:protein TonB
MTVSGAMGSTDARRGALMVLGALVAGLGVALALAWFMYSLIHVSEMRLSQTDQVQMLDFVRLKREELVERKDRKPEKPEVTQEPEAPPNLDQSASDAGQTLAVSAPTPLGTGIGLERSGIGIGSADGEYLPIVKVAPIYPRRALARGIEGTCVVRYSVTTLGTVRDVEVVSGQCSDPIFEHPSIEAAKRFKYKPRVIDGTALEVHGVYNMFHYERSVAGKEDGS